MSYSKLDRRIIDTYNKIVSALPNKSADRRVAECVDKDPDTGLIKAVGVYDTKTKKQIKDKALSAKLSKIHNENRK